MSDVPRFLILPGWLDSGPTHWQSRWERNHGFERVEQADWHWPRRGDWMARLDEVVLRNDRPVVLVAHSLGCQLAAAWSAHSRHTVRVQAALLVAPPDVDRSDTPPQLHNWQPAVRTALKFRALVVYSENDPFAEPTRSRGLAADWGVREHSIGAAGHINGESGLGEWPEGFELLRSLWDDPS